MRVLLVEDEPDGREMLAEILKDAGGEICAVSSASEAYEVVKSFRPHVLVSDIAMAQEDGYSLVRRLRRLSPEEGGRTPALALSAYAREEDRIRSLAAGFQQHMAKPLDPGDLVGAVSRLASRGNLRRGPAPPPGPGSRVLVVEDDGDSREGLRHLLEIWGHDVEVAENGTTGIEKAIDETLRLLDHEVTIEGQLAHRAACLYDAGPHRDVRDEMAVHDIEME